jgi:hydroxymethylbilane synthase
LEERKKSLARQMPKDRTVYPIALDLRGRSVVVVGGGSVAARKVRGLLDAGARLTVVSPSFDDALRDASPGLELVARPFETADLEGATLVFAATDDPAVNAAVVAAARASHVLVDDASDGARGDFSTPLAHRVGTLTFAVDTGGVSPSFARRLQRELRERFDERYAKAAATLGFARDYTKAVVPPERRADVMRELAERDLGALATMNPSTIENEVEAAYAALIQPEGPAASMPFSQLVCATRASALAMWQTRHVMATFAQHGLVSTVLQISTKGDRELDRSLSQLGTDGVFVKELERALRERRADYAVHSCKDLPSRLPPDMRLAAIGPRADARDAFCSDRYASLADLPSGALVGTSSPRRRALLGELRPDLRFETIRGNVDTRLHKLRTGEYDAIVLAMAGLVRLGVGATYTVPLEPDVMLPAVGQGALAIEVSAEATALGDRIHEVFADRATELAVTAERAFLRTLRGGCQAPVGAYATFTNDTLYMRAAIAAVDGSQVVRGSENVVVEDVETADALGERLARRLLAEGGAELLGGGGPLSGQLFLLPRTQERPSQIAPALRGAGAEVVEAVDSDEALTALAGRTPDGLLFPSSGSVRAIDRYLAALRDRPARPLVAAMGDASSAAASEAGFPPDIIATEATVGAFVQSVTRYVMMKDET